MPYRTLRDARILLTGASSGIGRALTIELARAGAAQVLLARSGERLAALAGELQSRGARVETVVGDVTSLEVRRQAMARCKESLGGLDIVINNAGAGALGHFATASPERLRAIFDVNLFAPAELLREAIPLLRSGARPLVVNIGSVLGLRSLPRMSEYCASKFALQGLSESLRPELATLGIELLMVCPGTTITEFGSHMVERRGETPWGQPAGLPADKCAARIVRAMQAGRRQIITDWPAWWLWVINRAMPGLVDRWMQRYG